MCVEMRLDRKDMTVGQEIRTKRVREGRSQRELTALLGLNDYSMLAKIESGLRFPRTSIPSLAMWLGIPQNVLIRRVADEKIEKQLRNTPARASPTFLPMEKIEAVALEDRERYLSTTGKKIELPGDREKIPLVLFGLRVIFADNLFGPEGEMLYGGLFPEGCYYHYVDNAIVVSTQWVKGEGLAAEETKTFQLFHEMGHYRLHLGEDVGVGPVQLVPERPVYCSSGASKPLEFQANAYASAFLIPKPRLREIIGDSGIVHLQQLERTLRSEFGVSRKTLLQRLKRLGIKAI